MEEEVREEEEKLEEEEKEEEEQKEEKEGGSIINSELIFINRTMKTNLSESKLSVLGYRFIGGYFPKFHE